ncbi:MAG: hypothetical protein WBC71_14370 [Salaquimonas sp.]
MNPVLRLLHWCADHGRWFLVAGLATGMASETAALFLRDYIPELAVCLLFLAAFRVGPKAAIGAAMDFRRALIFVILLQVILPVCLFFIFKSLGWTGNLPSAIALLSAGASVSAAPHLAVMSGHAPAPGLRLLVLGTALLPITIIPILWLLPQFGDAASVLGASAKLFAVIALSASVAFVLRHYAFPKANEKLIKAVDGLSGVFLYLIVVGLMAAVAPAIWTDLSLFFTTLLAAFAINFGLQLFFFLALKGERFKTDRVPFSIISGNRNMALFLTALPVSVTDPMLLFIGCYQIPMYLTPILLGRIYRKL